MAVLKPLFTGLPLPIENSLKYTPKESKTNVNVSQFSPLKDFFALLSGVLGILVALYLILGLCVDYIVPLLSAKAELVLASPFQEIYTDTEDNASSKKLQELLQGLVDAMPEKRLPYQVSLVNRELFNAMALPGGQIVVYSGLMDEIKSDHELAFVLAHELGHFVNRDHLKGLGRGLLLYTFLRLFIGPDNFATDFIGQSLVGVQMQFSQQQETAADLFALNLLHKRDGEVTGAISFMKKIAKREEGARFLNYFATHPHAEHRISTLKKEIENKGY